MLQSDNRSRLDSSWMGEQVGGGLLIGVFGSLDQLDVPLLRRFAHHTTTALAIALDVDGWATGGSGRHQRRPVRFGGAGADLGRLARGHAGPAGPPSTARGSSSAA